MVFSRVRANWDAKRTRLKTSEVKQFDENINRALDGYDGGVYEPNSDINIQNTNTGGLQVDDLTVNSSAIWTSASLDISTSSSINLNSTSSFNIKSNAAQTIESGGLLTIGSGAQQNVDGYVLVRQGGPGIVFDPGMYPNLTTRRVTYVQGLTPLFAGTGWNVGLNVSRLGNEDGQLLNVNTTDASMLWIELLRLPLFGTIKQLRLWVNGGSNHSSLPATMPKYTLKKRTAGINGFALIGSGVDTSQTVSEYETLHSIDIALSENVLTQSAIYHVVIEGETGSNALNNELEIKNLEVDVEVSKIGP